MSSGFKTYRVKYRLIDRNGDVEEKEIAVEAVSFLAAARQATEIIRHTEPWFKQKEEYLMEKVE